MKLLVIGSGGREHALVWTLARSRDCSELFAAPGNPGMARHARCIPIKADAVEELIAFVRQEQIDLTVVGPEQPLSRGVVDAFAAEGHVIFGPSKAAAALEASKAFAKALMDRHGIPTARFRTFQDPRAARAFCRELGSPLVVKADGLAGGKGSLVCRSLEEADRAVSLCLEERAFGASGERVVIEAFMEGEEVSCFALTDGEQVLPLAAAQDHKAVFDDDQGPNTGGMGAYSALSVLDEQAQEEVLAKIILPTVQAMAAEGRPFRGVLYAGLMITKEGPKVVEFNCRFGDPEAQVVLPRLDEDLLPILAVIARGGKLPRATRWRPDAAVCVVLASGGYPGGYEVDKPISGVPEAELISDVIVFHAGTKLRDDGALLTAGGRVFGVTALGPGIPAAIERAYEAASKISFEAMHYRKDIGKKALRRPAEA
ncbi:MAG: phosphoribosylamine--glycine ligase [Candidatus Methylomirabilia bacterium]